MEINKRAQYYDNLKVVLILLVIITHTGIPFLQSDWWLYKPSISNDAIPHFLSFLVFMSSFSMGVFFFISGFFIPYSYDKYGPIIFLKKKAIRFLIPTVVGALVFYLLLGNFAIYHLWYLEMMCIFSVSYVIIRILISNRYHINTNIKVPSYIVLCVTCFIIGAVTFVVRRYFNYYTFIWIFKVIMVEPIHFPQYLSMFILGILFYRCNWINQLSKYQGRIMFIIGSILGTGILLMKGFYFTKWYVFYESFFCVNFSVGLIWIFKEYGNKHTQLMRWCSQHAYGVYVFHLHVLYSYDIVFDRVMISPYVKFMCIAFLTIFTTFVFVYLLRKIPVVAKIL